MNGEEEVKGSEEQDEGKHVEEDSEEEEAGARRPERKHDPRAPIAQERNEHELTHMPF